MRQARALHGRQRVEQGTARTQVPLVLDDIATTRPHETLDERVQRRQVVRHPPRRVEFRQRGEDRRHRRRHGARGRGRVALVHRSAGVLVERRRERRQALSIGEVLGATQVLSLIHI